MNSAQIAALKADILDKSQPGQMFEGQQEPFIAAYYNTVTASDIWRTDAPVDAILDAISWDKYTPTDTPDATATFTNRLLAIQTKQMNLQNMIIGKTTINASKLNIRGGLRDCVIALPSGVAGAAVSAGGASGATVLAACVRKATNAEVMFSTDTGGATGSTTAKVPLFTEAAIYISPQFVSDVLSGIAS